MQQPEPSPASSGDAAHSRSHRQPAPWFVALVLALFAMLPRCLTLDDFFTVDESFHWVWRVMHFMNALEKEKWAATNLTGHPGVTTLWLGLLGRKLAFATGLYGPEWELGGVGYLALLRLPLVLANSISVGVGYLALRRLLRSGTALLAGLLWALSPFLIAHSRLLHLDALLTSAMTLSLLLLLLAIEEQRAAANQQPTTRGAVVFPWLLLAASGVCAGLALLTKAPSLVLLPLAGIALLLLSHEQAPIPRILRAGGRYGLWLGCAVALFRVGWPAMWEAPREAVGHVLEEIFANGARPHESGNFFLGRPLAVPGPFFYPAVVLWRSTPFLLVGLALLPLALLRKKEDDQHRREWRMLLALAGFVLVFGLAMSILPKKFDRYLLPVWPSLNVLAAAGLMVLFDGRARIAAWMGRAFGRWGARLAAQSTPGAVLALCVGAPLALLNLWYHPFYLSYFNPVPGGGTVAQHVLLVGWGEGMEQVGAWLRTRPDLALSPVASWGPRTLEPFVPVRVVELNEQTLAEPVSYAVLYARGVQRREQETAHAYVRQTTPLYTLRMYGIDYAWIYQPIRPYTEPSGARFGEGLVLHGFRQEMQGHRLVITPSWGVQADGEGGWFCFVHVLAANGERVSQVDVPIDGGLFARWQAGQQFSTPLMVDFPPDLPPGEYRVALGVYNLATSSRMVLQEGEKLPPHLDGEDVLHLTTLTLP